MKMGTLPTVFPRSAYSLTSLRDLLDKVTWKEVGSARRFIVCFNEHKENEHDEDATQTPVATPQKAKHQSAGPSSRRKSPTKKKLRREFKPSAIDVMIKKEKVALPSSSSKGEGKAVDVSDEEEGGEVSSIIFRVMRYVDDLLFCVLCAVCSSWFIYRAHAT